MTNWEKSCVEALVISPTAFALFKAKQKNKKHIDQYLNKIWPYKITKEVDNLYSQRGNELQQIINQIKNLKKNYEKTLRIEFKKKIKKEDLIKQIKENFNKNSKFKNIKGIGIKITFHEEDGDEERETFFLNTKEYNLVGRLQHRIECLYRTYITKIDVSLSIENLLHCSSSDIDNSALWFIDNFVKQFNINKNSKYRRKYEGQNVGIEIEYDGPWQKYLHRHLNSSKYAISFNSGIDGGDECMNKDYWSNQCRLRENRLRINGARGLNALYFLLESMKKDKCSMTTRSGMHYHIDLRNRDISPDLHLEQIMPKNILLKLAKYNLFKEVFEFENIEFESESQIINLFRYPTEFDTIEWRFGSPSLNFTKLTIQILFAIHVTNVIFTENKKVDIEYLTFLSTLMTKTNF